MAKVKIILDKDETLEDAEADIVKAINHHSSGDVHSEEQFLDPAMIDVANRLEKLHQDEYKALLNEIFDALDGDYSNGY